MATVHLLLDLPPNFNDSFVATWDVVSGDMKVIGRGSFFQNGSASLQLTDVGAYWARLQLPNGETQTQAFVIDGTDDDLEVRFDCSAPSRHEWLSWASVGESPELVELGERSTALSDLWTRAWTLEHGQWIPNDDAVNAGLERDAGLYQLDMGSQGDQPRALQIGGKEIASRFVVLPARGRVRLLIVATSNGGGSEDGRDSIEVAVSLQNSVADNLVRFLTVAQPGSDAGWSRELRQKSMDLLSEKAEDPLAAVVGGYFIVQDKDAAPLDWLRNLAIMTGWMADGFILLANAMVLRKGRDEGQLALEQLERAAQCGYPVFRRGVRLYLDTLRILESDKETLIPQTIRDQARMYALASAADTRQSAFTSFFGTRPDAPDPQRQQLGSSLFAQSDNTLEDAVSPALKARIDLERFGSVIDRAPTDAIPNGLGDYGIRRISSE